jgi:hypothetical protein
MVDVPDYVVIEVDEELEVVIADLIRRKHAAVEGSAEYAMVMRQLSGLRDSREEAGPIMEDLDPFGWGSTDRLERLEVQDSKVVPLRSVHRDPLRSRSPVQSRQAS